MTSVFEIIAADQNISPAFREMFGPEPETCSECGDWVTSHVYGCSFHPDSEPGPEADYSYDDYMAERGDIAAREMRDDYLRSCGR